MMRIAIPKKTPSTTWALGTGGFEFEAAPEGVGEGVGGDRLHSVGSGQVEQSHETPGWP